MNKIIEQIKKAPRVFTAFACVITIASMVGLLTAATSITVLPTKAVIVSTATAPTNTHFGLTTNGIWPCAIIGGDIVTNLVAVDVSQYKEVTIEAGGSLSVAAGAVTGQQVVWTIYKNVAGGSPTNAVGTGLWLEKAGTITNAFATSAPVGSNSVSSLTLSGSYSGTVPTGFGGSLGGMTTIYIGICDASTITNGGGYFTNYAAYVYGK